MNSLNFRGRRKTKKNGSRYLQEDPVYRIRTRLISWFRPYVRWRKKYFSNFRDFPGKADSVILLGFEYTINPQNLMKIIGAIFEKMKIKNFFLIWTSLNFEDRSKTKKRAGDTCKGTSDIESEQDWSVGLSATLGDMQKIKNYFSSSGIFPGKADSVILLSFECTINPQNLIKIVRAIFEKFEIFNFFSHANYP